MRKYRPRLPLRDSSLSFLEASVNVSFDLPANDAIGYFQSKGLRASFGYGELTTDAQHQAFTVAKMMDLDLLAQVRESLDDALANGVSFRDWSDDLIPTLQASGWWGRKDVIDPLTGATVNARLGTPSRLETIFRVNMQGAYAAGHWRMIEEQADVAPFLMYDAVDDFRTRPEHRLWDRKVLPVGHPWWRTHYPPNGFNCRCGVIQLSGEEVEALGLSTEQTAPQDGTYTWKNPRTGGAETIPTGVDPGFDGNVGRAYMDSLISLFGEKVARLPISLRNAAQPMATAMRQPDYLDASYGIAAGQAATAAELAAQREAIAQAEQEAAADDELDAIADGRIEADNAEALRVAYQQLRAAGRLESMSAVDALGEVRRLANV